MTSDAEPKTEPPTSNAPVTAPSAGDGRNGGAHKLFLVGSWLFVLVGAGHLLLAHFPFLMREATGSEALVHQGMRMLQPMPGTSHTLFDFYVGNSFSVGLIHVAFGAQSLFAARIAQRSTGHLPLSLVVVATLAGWASVFNALLYFPPPPIALLGMATSCLTLCLATSLKAPRLK